MTGTQLSSATLDPRRRRILYRAWRRGTRELDLLLGHFADARLATLDDAGVADFERLLDLPDRDLMAWLMDEIAPPPEQVSPIYVAVRDFHAARTKDAR